MKRNGSAPIWEACRKGTLYKLAEHYIASCKDREEAADEAPKKGKQATGRFPNIAGFCRCHKVGFAELVRIEQEFPEQVEQLYMILEDEALNSGLPPPILSAYLKKRLGYERDGDTKECPPTEIRFEHDIFRDGE